MMAVKLTFEKFISRRCGTKRSRRLSVRESQKRSAFPQTHTNMQIHAPTQTQTHAHTHTHTHTHAHTHVVRRSGLYIHTHTHEYTHIYTHTPIQKHTRGQKCWRRLSVREWPNRSTRTKNTKTYTDTRTHTHTHVVRHGGVAFPCVSRRRGPRTHVNKKRQFFLLKNGTQDRFF